MKKDVWVYIVSHFDYEEEAVQMLARGRYYKKNGKHYVLYDHADTQSPYETKPGRLTFNETEAEMLRGRETQLRFQKDGLSTGKYNSGLGVVVLTLDTSELQLTETQEQIQLTLCYKVLYGDMTISENKVVISVTPQNEEGFRLPE